MTQEACFLLGALDPEMKHIEVLCEKHGLQYVYAKYEGRRVTPRTAYMADNVADLPDNCQVVFVECAMQGIVPAYRIDHHDPGDPGYDKGPSEYWEGSSLGQFFLYNDLNDISLDDRVIAAIDHCFQAAVDGMCTNIDVADVIDIKIADIALDFGKTEKEVRQAIYDHINGFSDQKTEMIEDQEIYIIEITVPGYSYEYLCMRVAAALVKKPLLVKRGRGDKFQFHLCGKLKQKTIEEFVHAWAPNNNLLNIYSNHHRGYAGGYIE